MNDEKIIVIKRLRKLIDDRKAHIISDAEHDCVKCLQKWLNEEAGYGEK